MTDRQIGPGCEEADVFRRTADRLIQAASFIVTAHERADGDAIAAVCTVSELLRRMNKRVVSVLADSRPDPRYAYLLGFDRITSADTDMPAGEWECGLILDSPTLDRIGTSRRWIESCEFHLCIDHHLDPAFPGSDHLIRPSASSTCEILSDLLHFLPVDLTPDLAESLYTGIVFDTGNFRFSNTSSHTLKTASVLVSNGADPERIAARLFYGWSMLRVRAMAQVLQSLTLFFNQQVAITLLPEAFFSSHSECDSELEGFSDLGISVSGVKIAIFFKEKRPNDYKISLRASESYDVGSVAQALGGGGHRKAAGCRWQGTFTEARDAVLSAIIRFNPRLTSR